jgi:hypothetical protein
MPGKRARPNKKWLSSKPPRPSVELNPGQSRSLKAIAGLPEVVLPAVKKIAARFIRQARHPTPTTAEMRASLRSLGRLTVALERGIKETDVFTLHFISPNYERRLRGFPGTSESPSVPERLLSELDKLKKEIGFRDWLLSKQQLPNRKRSRTVANEVRSVFQQFNVPFSLSKESPAVETVYKILNMVRQTGLDAARGAVRRAMSDRDKKRAPV